MTLKTEDVRKLVKKGLLTVPCINDSDVIDQVAAEIEVLHRLEYNALCSKLTKDVVNTWIGRWTKRILDRKSVRQVPAKRSKIIGSFTLLK